MKPYKLLSLDESGKASYSHPSKIFILSGVIIPEKFKPKIEKQMKKIKKKYFKDEDVVFHGRDMARCGVPFNTLLDNKVAKQFWSEFVSVVSRPGIVLYFVVTNKKNAQKAGWQTKTILERSYFRILSEFSKNLKTTKFGGRIINESDSEQDPYLIHAHNRLQSSGIGDGSISGKEYQKIITSLSLVNKTNNDIDLQIADTVAFVGRLKYERDVLGEIKIMTPAERMKYRLVEKKVKNKNHPGLFEVLI